MGSSTSTPTKYIDLNKNTYIVIDLYLKPKNPNYKNFDLNHLKTNEPFKKNLQNIIVSALSNKLNYEVFLTDNNMLFTMKKDKDNDAYLELNAILQFGVKDNKLNTSSSITDIGFISKEQMKLYVLNKLFELFHNQIGIITPEITVLILYKTLYHIDIFQK